MNTTPYLVVLYLSVFGLSCGTARGSLDFSRTTPVPATEQIPTMDFFRPSALLSPQLNPAGTHLAAITTADEDRHQLYVSELGGTGEPEVILAEGDRDITSVDWLGDKRVMFTVSTHKLWGLGLYAANVGRLRETYPLLQYYGARVVAIPHGNPTEPLVWCQQGISTDKELGCVTLNTGLSTGHFIDLVSVTALQNGASIAREQNDRNIIKAYPMPDDDDVGYGYLADKDGNLEFAFRYDKDGHSQLYRLEGEKWIKCPIDVDDLEVVGSGEQRGQLVVRGPRQEGKPRALQFIDAATGKLGEVLMQDDAYDFFGGLYRDPVTHRILGVSFDRRAQEVFWFTELHQNLQKMLDKLFPGVAVRIVSMNDAQSRFIVATYSDRQPVTYYWVDLEKRTQGPIKSTKPWIDPQRMRPRSIIKYKTRDGHQMDAYLTIPAGVSKKSPGMLVVLPHGGPWARDGWGFDSEAQFFASRGYIVLQPNYRGSDGYSWQFPEMDKYDFWKMHEDVTDATKTLIASGIVQQGKVAIAGSSFGGYLAISGVVNDPDLYCCAVTIAGVFDWERHLKVTKRDRFDTTAYRFFLRYLGDPKKNQARYDAISPGRHIDRVKVPVFVAAGREDSRVEIEQAESLLSALRKYDVPHESMLMNWEGHGMAYASDEVKMYDRIIAFLDKYMKQPGATPAAAP